MEDRFNFPNGVESHVVRGRLADLVRLERKKLSLSQRKFAEYCDIPLRTYKRFELNECDSIAIFIRIILTFESISGSKRLSAFSLLFPPPLPTAQPRTPIAALERLQLHRRQKEKKG